MVGRTLEVGLAVRCRGRGVQVAVGVVLWGFEQEVGPARGGLGVEHPTGPRLGSSQHPQECGESVDG